MIFRAHALSSAGAVGRQIKIRRRLGDSFAASALNGPSMRSVPTWGKKVKPGVGPVCSVSRMKC